MYSSPFAKQNQAEVCPRFWSSLNGQKRSIKYKTQCLGCVVPFAMFYITFWSEFEQYAHQRQYSFLSSNIEQYEILMWSCNILLVAHCILFCKNTLGDLFSVLNFLKRFIQWTIRCMQKMKLWQFALDLLDLPNSDLSWNFVAENIEMKITQITKVEELPPASIFNTLRCSQIGCLKKS